MSIEKYEKQANKAYILSALAYLDLALFRNKYGEPVLPDLDNFINKRNSYNSKFKIIDRFINKDTFNLNVSLGDLFNNNVQYLGKDNAGEFAVAKMAIEYSKELQSMEVLNSSALTQSYSKSTLDAITVQHGKELYIVFRGTGAGKWLDNGMGLYTTSEMQLAAARYAQEMIKLYGDGKKIYLTGHSKGGNLAQASLMLSKVGTKVDKVFSFDGQGFSKEAIEQFSQRHNYDNLRAKIFQIADSNDFVGSIGMPIAIKENTIYIEGFKNAQPHSLSCIGAVDKLLLNKRAEQGPIGTFVKAISTSLMLKDRDFIGHCSLSLMGLVEKAMHYKNADAKTFKHQGSGFIKTSNSYDLKTLLKDGLPIIIEHLKSEQGRKAFEEFSKYDSLSFITKLRWPIIKTLEAELRLKLLQHSLFMAKPEPLPEVIESETYKLIKNIYKDYDTAIKDVKNIIIESEERESKVTNLKEYMNLLPDTLDEKVPKKDDVNVEKILQDVYVL